MLASLLLSVSLSAAIGQTENTPPDAPRPHWIWVSQGDSQRVYFRKVFSAPAGVTKAMLLGLADDRATIYLNGREVADIQSYQRPARIEIGPLTEEDNVVAVEVENKSGTAGLLLRLEFQADGHRKSLATDASWLTASQPGDGWQTAGYEAEGWVPAVDLGPLGIKPWGDPTGEIDDYNQWRQATAGQATDPATISLPEGFAIELLRTATPEEGSWISLDFDPRGRLVVAREDKGLLRFTLAESGEAGEQVRNVETINDTLLECRGLLHAYGDLYVNANNSKALYRLRDADGDDRYETAELLLATEGGVGHGRNDLALGPDGMIYAIHGNNVRLPDDNQGHSSPLAHYAEDRLLKCGWDATMFDSDVRAPAGHLLRMDRDGRQWQVVAGGLRNCYGIDFNADGELFSYESDMEWDIGLPWYRPTRVLHFVSGGDYGYRQGTRMWPWGSPDMAPSSVDIGKGSPTGVKFGTRSNFPPRYRRALFVLDWAYGRIFAVHLSPRGAGYDCSAELFVKGRPLNVTDLDFGRDGAMYFVVGGRRTQSALYRVRYTGPKSEEPAPDAEELARQEEARNARSVRRQLESYHGRCDPKAVVFAWPHLESDDIWICQAARVAIEAQPVNQWLDRAMRENRPTAALTALMALTRVGSSEMRQEIFARLDRFPLSELTEEQQLIALRVYGLAVIRFGQPDAATSSALAARLNCFYPSPSPRVNQELCELLVVFEARDVVAKTMPLVLAAKTQEERLRYLFALREVRQGWTLDDRRTFFEWLRPEGFAGAHTMPLVLANLRKDAIACLTDDERNSLSPLLAALDKPAAEPASPVVSRPFVWNWQLADLVDSLDRVSAKRDLAHGRELFKAALCDRCHRLAGSGSLVGPELTGCGNRFGRKDLLETILSPSKFVDEKYRQLAFELTDGKVVTGRITGDDGRSLVIASNPLDPTQVSRIDRGQIESRSWSLVSPMPSGLLNTLSKEEILDLLAYLIADGYNR